MTTEFSWPYRFDTSQDAWTQIRNYSLVPLIAFVLLFPGILSGLLGNTGSGQRLAILLFMLGLWFTFSLVLFTILKPVRGTVTANTVSIDPVRFFLLPTTGDSGTFSTRDYSCVTVQPVAFSRLKEVTLTSSKGSISPAIHLGHFDANEAERLAAHLSEHTGIPSTDEVAETAFRKGNL